MQFSGVSGGSIYMALKVLKVNKFLRGGRRSYLKDFPFLGIGILTVG
jgi:hypothetical protein